MSNNCQVETNTSTTKHTPGPWGWVIHDHSMATLGVLPDPGLGDPLVLDVRPCRSCADRATPQEWKWGRCCTPSEANAYLIAAAPDLLAALKAIVNMTPDDEGDIPLATVCGPDDYEGIDEPYRNALAAIAKAEL